MREDATNRFRIRSLEIEDFRGIRSLKLEFLRSERPLDLVVLAGDNGCGKTSVLEAIVRGLGKSNLLPDDAISIEDIDGETRFGAARFRLRICVERALASGVIARELNMGPQEIKSPHIPMAFFEGKIGNGPISPSVVFLEQLRPEVEYFSARREPEALGANPGPRGPRSEREARRLVELKRRLTSAYNRRLRAQVAGQPAINSPYDRVQRFFRRFNQLGWELDVIPVSNDPGSGDEVVLREPKLVPDDVTSLTMARSLAPNRPDIPRMIPLDRLSSGEMALLAFAGPLAFRDSPADIVLIDEPEQHLHEQWRRHLMRGLRELSPASQFIVATHSREVLESALSDERCLLVRPGDPRQQREDSTEMPVAPEQ